MATEPDMADAPDGESTTSFGLFYGTLMAPEIFFTVCYGTARPPSEIVQKHVFRDAFLPGFTRHRVRNRDYPGVLADDAAGACVRGMLVGGLTKANMLRLDRFEGSEYERREVQVEVAEPGDGAGEKSTESTKTKVAALVYVYKYADNLDLREWDFEEFRREKMHRWTRNDLTFEDC